MGTLLNLYSPLSPGEWLLFAFAIALALLIGVVIAEYLDRDKKVIKLDRRSISSLIFVSLWVELFASLYLLLFEPALLNQAPVHWGALLIYTMGNVALLELYLIANGKSVMKAATVWSFLGVFGILLDAGLNFPFSQLYGYGGISYAFGFGTSGTGTFGVSFALVLLLVFSVVTMFRSHLRSLEEKKRRKR